MTGTPDNASRETRAPEKDRVRWLREQITKIKEQWPRHSVPPGMLQRLEDLEEELENELRKSSEP